MRKKGIPEVLVRSVMSLYEGAKARVRVNSELSENSQAKLGIHQGLHCHHLFAVVVDVVTELAREGVLGELLNADELVLISERIKGLRNKFLKWKEAFECKGLKVNLGKTKVMVSDGITKDGLPNCKVAPCGVCSLRVKPNTFFGVQ